MKTKILGLIAGIFLMVLAIGVSAQQTTDQYGGYGGRWGGGGSPQGGCNSCGGVYGGGGYGGGYGGGRQGGVDPHYPLFPVIDGLNHGLLGGLFNRFPGGSNGLPGFNNQQGGGYGGRGGGGYGNQSGVGYWSGQTQGGGCYSCGGGNMGNYPADGGYGRGGNWGRRNPPMNQYRCLACGGQQGGYGSGRRSATYEQYQKYTRIAVNW